MQVQVGNETQDNYQFTGISPFERVKTGKI